jgi:peptidoglycan/xylan/chitin deacetylase (PgdA/CDA1 family)
MVMLAGTLALAGTSATAAPCGNPNALGVSRVISVSARDTPLIGTHDYGRTLPLAEGEVVLTFDDGPKPPYTQAVLKALAQECVRAVFFMVGRQALAHPDVVRHIHASGHTIGTHTQSHPLYRMPPDRAEWEINAGIASVGAALGNSRALAPFFRFPGLFRTVEAERYLRSRAIAAWSVDVDSYDWKRTGPNQMLQHTLAQLDTRRGGILLMHDVQPKTALMLPTLLAELKSRGYRIVQVVPRGTNRDPLAGLVAASSPQRQSQPPGAAMSAPQPHEITGTLGRAPAVPVAPRRRDPGSGGLFEAIFTSSTHRWGR